MKRALLILSLAVLVAGCAGAVRPEGGGAPIKMQIGASPLP
jgi:hypothetical protein